MHLMPNTTLLAASLQYGVVSRSYPLSGKVLRGFLDASGTANGLGNGNPNAEFSPHVSSVALASEGGTAKILWGYRNGEVAVTTAVRVMDNNRASAARLVRCRLLDCHEGAVTCVAWAHNIAGSALFISGGVDGRVKLWDAKTSLKCLWTSPKGDLLPDPCVKLTLDLQRGVVVAGLGSGSVLVWTGFPPILLEPTDLAVLEPQQLRIPAPANTASSGISPYQGDVNKEILDLHICPLQDRLSILVAYQASPFFYRFALAAAPSVFEGTLFGNEGAAPIRCLLPVWAPRDGESSFVLAGDELGDISVFPWDVHPPRTSLGAASVPPAYQFDAHEDGAITALNWNSAILVSGSSRGTVQVWDALTFAPLRSFASPAARPTTGAEWDGVSQILLDRDVLMVSVGSRVMSWKAGPVGRPGMHGKGKTMRATRSSGTAKWHQQLEMYRDIAESRRELEEEQTHTRRTFGREREQLSTLSHLGLSEVEAVEYVLMLSRDEEEARSRHAVGSSAMGEYEGVFMADFDEVPTPMAMPSTMFGAESSAAPSRTSSFSGHPSPSSSTGTSVFQGGRASPRAMPSTSNHKIQVSPRFHPEPMEAGSSVSPLPSRSTSSSGGIPPPVSDFDHFPAVSRTPSSTSGSAGAGTSVASTPASSVKESVVGSPHSVHSAWNTPLHSLQSSEAPSPSRIAASPSQSPARSLPGALAMTRLPELADGARTYVEEDDEDLRFAIELSLAEARSRGENI
ncbi:WD40-repeat-containing domain protein [Trametes meyenii]|nr:WD40-repeat-containing domain protein [Trametes meyenii]